MFIDIGSALNSGVQGYRQAEQDNEKLRALNQQLKLQQQQAQLQQQLGKQKLDAGSLQIQQIKNQLLKQKIYQALDAYRESNGDNRFLNRLLQDDPDAANLLGAIRVENISKDDYPELQKHGINPQILTQNPFRYVKIIKPDGSTDYIDMNAIYGATGYTNYLTQQKLQQLKAQMGILPLQKYQEQEQAKQDWINLYTKAEKLGGVDKLSPPEQAKYKMLQKQFSFAPTNLDKAAEAVSDGTEVTETLYNSFKDPKTLQSLLSDKDFINKAREYQILTGRHMLSQDRKNYLSQLNMVKEGYNILNQLSKLSEEEIAKGPLDEGLQKLRQYFTSDKLKEMSPQDRLKFIKSINTNTKVGLLVKNYLLAMSGQGVTDQEYSRVRDLLEGGNFSNLPALKAALSSFYNLKANDLVSQLQAEANSYPADTIDIIKPYNKYLFIRFKMNPNTMNLESSGVIQNKQSNKKEILNQVYQMLDGVKVK